MRPVVLSALLAAILAGSEVAAPQDMPGNSPQQTPYQNMTPEQRANATRAFLGLGAEPDKAAAERGAPLFLHHCAVCHGRQARGATGPGLITSDLVLGDDHGERLVPFLKKGRPEKDMPSFATVPAGQLKDIAEFLHLEVEEVANRGAYRVLNILVGDPAKGEAYVSAHCMTCHTPDTFAHIGARFHSPEQLQRGWIWPSRAGTAALALAAVVRTPSGTEISGRVTQISDFRVTLTDAAGQTHAVDRGPGVVVELKDPLAPHQEMIQTLGNDDMHNVTAYLETLK